MLCESVQDRESAGEHVCNRAHDRKEAERREGKEPPCATVCWGLAMDDSPHPLLSRYGDTPAH